MSNVYNEIKYILKYFLLFYQFFIFNLYFSLISLPIFKKSCIASCFLKWTNSSALLKVGEFCALKSELNHEDC